MKKILFLSLFLMVCTILSAQKRVKVACVGNSITYGYTLPNPATDSYPSQLQQLLGETYEVGNFGKSGATLLNKGHRPYMQQEEFKKAIAFAGDIVVIHLGINDTDPRDWPNYRDSFVKDYLALIDSFRVANPKCHIIIARLTPIADRHPRFESGTRDWHGEIQQSIETIAKYAGVQLMDFHEPLYPYPYLLPDAVHPNVEGAGILAKTVYSAITGDFGGLHLSELYTDNMVLQHGEPLAIRGKANAGEKVTVSIAKQKLTAKAASNGDWTVTIQPLKAGGPYTLTVSAGKQKQTFNNVLAGEVWLCSGQSNMEFYLSWSKTAKRDIPQAANDQIRLFDMKARWRTDAVEWDASVLDSLNHLQYYKDTEWTVCSPATAGSFSAVAYYFGKMLQDSLKVPVGLICNAIGGSPTEAWVDRSTLEYKFPAKRDIPQAANDQIRLFDMKARWRTDAVEWDASVLDSLNHLQYYKDTEWTVCSPATAGSFSAVAYYFGKMLQDSLKVPVGLICNAIGGSPTEAWVDRSTLEYKFPAILRNWTQNDFIQDWVRGRAALNVKKATNKQQRHPYEPCYLYEAGIRPLEQYPIKGIIWYQGESNAHNREAHEKLFKLLVESWRKNWENENLPFYYVQLSSINRPSWPWFRDSQRRMMYEIPHTGMAVSSDLGDSLDVHPKHKQPVGERLAHWALNQTYGKKNVTPSGPMFRNVEFRDGAAYVSFDCAEGMHASDGKPLQTFEVAETEDIYYPATAEIVGNQIKVYSKEVKNPLHVRYGWQPFTRANLVNGDGLPASTFRTDWGK